MEKEYRFAYVLSKYRDLPVPRSRIRRREVRLYHPYSLFARKSARSLNGHRPAEAHYETEECDCRFPICTGTNRDTRRMVRQAPVYPRPRCRRNDVDGCYGYKGD